MTKYVTVESDKEQVTSAISRAIDEVVDVMSLKKPHVVIKDDSRKVTSWVPTTVGLTAGTGTSSVIRHIMLDAVGRSESEGPGSGEFCLALTVEFSRRLSAIALAGGDTRYALDALQHASGDFCEAVRRHTRPGTWKITEAMLDSILGDVAPQISFSLKQAGFNGKVNVCRETSDMGSVTISTGHTFSVLTFTSVVPDSWSGIDVTVIPIDGHVERVSEIHHILEAMTGGQACILIARGFSEDVISTLSVNRLRGTLNVIPVVASFDNEGANTLKDIAVVCDTDVISSLKGELISSICVDDFRSVASKAEVKHGKVTLFTKDSDGLKGHVTEIRKMVAEADGFKRDLLEKRLRSLCANSVDIVLPHDKKHMLEMVDLGLRSVKSVVTHGYVLTDDISDVAQDLFGVDPCTSISNHVVSPVSLVAPVRYGISAAGSIVSIGAILQKDVA